MRSLIQFKRLALVFVGMVFVQTAFCQENFLNGFIIRMTGDTIKGYIDYRNWETNPDKIAFKELMSSSKTVYTPNDIKQFNVKDESYESAVVETEVSPEKISELQIGNALTHETVIAFMQSMIKGPKSLYYFRNKIGKDQFYIKQDSGFELLTYKKYLVQQNGGSAIAENKRYLNQLSLYLSDCPTIQSKLKFTEYNKATLFKLFQYYYDYTHTGIKFKREAEKLKTEIGVLGGMSTTSLKFKSNSTVDDYLTNAKFSSSQNLNAGFLLNVIFPRNNGKLSIYNELNLSFYDVKGQYDKYDEFAPADYNIHTFSNIGFSYVRLINMLRYKYPVGVSSIFAGIGISNGIAFNSTNFKRVETNFYSSHTVTEGKALDAVRIYEQGLVFDLGTNFNVFTVEIRVEKGNGMSDNMTMSSTTTRYSFLVGFKF